MDIVVLDGYALNPGDLSWDGLKKIGGCGNLRIYDRTPPDQVVPRIGNAEIVFTNKTVLTDEIFAACPSLRYVGILATGFNVVDTESAARRGIAVTNVPGYSTSAVVQHLFALIFEWTNQIHIHSESVMKGEWVASPDFCYWKTPLMEISGKTLGIFGFGSIGQKAAGVALAFGMNVSVCTRSVEKIEKSGLNVKPVSLETLFSDSDFITLHAPLTNETRFVVNSGTLAKVKPGAMLINTARGPLVDENAVREALDSGRLGCYAADVISSEPMAADNPLLGAPNCILTPHIAWAPKETRNRLARIAVSNLEAFFRGEKLNRIV